MKVSKQTFNRLKAKHGWDEGAGPDDSITLFYDGDAIMAAIVKSTYYVADVCVRNLEPYVPRRKIIKQLKIMFPNEDWVWDGRMWAGTTFNVHTYAQKGTSSRIYRRSDTNERLLIRR